MRSTTTYGAPLTLVLSLLLCLTVVLPASATEDRGADAFARTGCSAVWLAADGSVTTLDGDATVVRRPQAGTFTFRCLVPIPDDPGVAPFEAVCAFTGELCRNGAVIVKPADDPLFGGCTITGGWSSDETFAVATRSGNYVFVCHGEYGG